MPDPRARLTADDAPPSAELTERVGRALAEGGLVLLPTETVYGIAARADDPRALERLFAAKGRPQERAATWHAADSRALERFEAPCALARRLAERYWPGPLTLVLPGTARGVEALAREDWTGLRVPAHALTRGLLAALEFPLAISSANRHGEPPACEVGALAPELAEKLALVVDAGPARLGEASSILRVGRGRFELVRAGLFTLEQLRRAAGLRIGFACTGNTCRSPMAEALARQALARRLGCLPERLADFGFELVSMGVLAASGAPASPLAAEELARRGIDLGGHAARVATAELAGRQDRLYGMTWSHVEALRLALPPSKAERVELLDPQGRDLPDPIGGGPEDYRACAARIEEALAARLGEWA